MIKTAILPVAGMGTRFLPATKVGPKEMLPIVDRPIIQYVVEEALAVGIEQFIIVTSGSKHAIEDYFDSNNELEAYLKENGKFAALNIIQSIVPANVTIAYVRQPKPLGLGDAVLRAQPLIGNHPFAVLLADDLMERSHEACLQQMIRLYQQQQASVIAVQEVAREDTDKYGIVSIQSDVAGDRVTAIVEKPSPLAAPSCLAVTGRYILTPRIFSLLARTKQGVGGEIQLTDAIAMLLQEQRVYCSYIRGKRYDCGSCQGFLEATIDFALQRPELREQMQRFLQIKVNEMMPVKN